MDSRTPSIAPRLPWRSGRVGRAPLLSLLFLAIPWATTPLIAAPAAAAEIRVAVASNFVETIRGIASRFEDRTDHEVLLATGSTGKHYAQIVSGAPFEVFFAADSRRPRLLEESGEAVVGSRFTYAVGRLVLWSPDEGVVDASGDVLERGRFRYLAVANPRLAPYGLAAREVLESRGLWRALQDRMVRGENVGQAFQFVASGNADLGFVASSQIVRPGRTTTGSFWAIPPELHTPIEQQAILLKNDDAAREFLAFVRSETALAIIRSHGYGTP